MSFNLNQAPDAVKSIAPEKVRELDVRPILKSGGEPFSAIMQTVKSVSADGAMRLRATFEPVPLFRVLGSQGWEHWVELGEGDDWIIWFYRASEKPGSCGKRMAAELSELAREFPELSSRLKAEASLWTLDVRGMAPPEPMELTLAVAERLPAGATLTQVNERVPQFLLPLLKERGLSHEILEDGAQGEVRIRIRRVS